MTSPTQQRGGESVMKVRCQAAPPDLLAPSLCHSQTGALGSWEHFCDKTHLLFMRCSLLQEVFAVCM